jgi:hypothetical protein
MSWTSDVHLPSPNYFTPESTPEVCSLAGILRKIILREYARVAGEIAPGGGGSRLPPQYNFSRHPDI